MTPGTIRSLQREIELEHLGDTDIALAVWSTDNAQQVLAIVERFRAAGVPLILVDEGKAALRSTDGFHPCAPGYDPLP
jgi:hypothetical protein